MLSLIHIGLKGSAPELRRRGSNSVPATQLLLAGTATVSEYLLRTVFRQSR